MKTNLAEFIKSKMVEVEKAIAAREESSKAWRGGTDKSWKAVGCYKSKPDRIAVAEREERILIKLRHELEMFNGVLEILTTQREEAR